MDNKSRAETIIQQNELLSNQILTLIDLVKSQSQQIKTMGEQIKSQSQQIKSQGEQIDNFELKLEHLTKQKNIVEIPASPRLIPSSPRYTSKNLKSTEIIESIVSETESFKFEVSRFADAVNTVMESKNKRELYYRKVFSEISTYLNSNSANVKFVNFYDLLNKNVNIFSQLPKHIIQIFKTIQDKEDFYYIDKGEGLFSTNLVIYIYSP
jgi:hypothetical protein